MELEWGYSRIVIPVVNTVYYTVKLRFSEATIGWIYTDRSVRVRRTQKGYYLLEFATTDPAMLQSVRRDILKGQQAQLSYILKMWIETGYRMRPMDATNPEIIVI